ncbi:MAG: rhodanese-like domain-containing protein [Pirellulaceae bacterium]
MFKKILSIFRTKPSDQSLADLVNAIREQKVCLIDVRETREWNEEHIAEAISLPLSQIRTVNDIKQLTGIATIAKPIVLHCVMGKRSAEAAVILNRLGVEATSIDFGCQRLENAGLTCVRGS